MYSVFILALVSTLALVTVIRPLAVKVGLVDQPCTRKRHDGVIPLVGGVVIYAALAITTIVFSHWGARNGLGMIMLGLPVLLVGVVDDRQGLSPSARFIVEIACCGLAAEYFGVRLEILGSLIPNSTFALGMFALPVTLIGMVGVINAFNMTDGVDGLAGGLAFLTFCALAFLSYEANLDIAQQLVSVAACLLGFLYFNSRFFGRAKAVIFMGDGGTLFIGFTLAWYLVLLSQGPHAVIRPVSALWFFGVPLLDTMSVMIRRIRRGQSPFHADREHLHHIFLLAGFGVNRSVLIILAFQAVFILFAIFALRYNLPEWISFGCFVVLFLLYYWCMNYAWRVMKSIRSFREWASFEDRRHIESSAPSGRRAGADRRKKQVAYEGEDRRVIRERRVASDRRAAENRQGGTIGGETSNADKTANK